MPDIRQSSAVTAEVIPFILIAIICHLKLINPFNNGSLRTERQIQTIRKMIIKHLTGKGEIWPLYTVVSAYSMNAFASSVVSCFEPFEFVFVRYKPDLLSLAFLPLEKFANINKDCLQLLKGKAEFIADILLHYKTHQAQHIFLMHLCIKMMKPFQRVVWCMC